MPERLNGPVSKTGVGATPPGVQIPLSPPKFNHLHIIKSVTKITLGITWNYLEYFLGILSGNGTSSVGETLTFLS